MIGFLKRYQWWFCSFILVAVGIGGYAFLLAPPPNFPSGDIIVVSRGSSVSDISRSLANAHIIQNPLVFKLIVRISGASSQMKSGAYLFSAPENVFTVANRLVRGAYGIPPVSLTFPEGVTVRDMAERISQALPIVSAKDFISIGKSHEGYLFPDTYFFPPDATAELVIEAMRKNFDAKITPLSSDIQASGHSFPDIIIMASLVEKEARTETSKRIVAGILWNRMKISMPLQVDAVFGYIFDRDTYSPSFADLKVDSPYNTYLHTGLPPGPIANPGLESIRAALYPATTTYLYYLTGKDNLMHYATTYAEHQSNRKKYLY